MKQPGKLMTLRNSVGKEIQASVLTKPFSFWNSLCSVACKGRVRLSFDKENKKKRGFSNHHLQKSIYLVTLIRFHTVLCYIGLISPSDFEKNTFITLPSNREYHLRSLDVRIKIAEQPCSDTLPSSLERAKSIHSKAKEGNPCRRV